MKVYLAAKFQAWPTMREIRDVLVGNGIDVTSRWFNGTHELRITTYYLVAGIYLTIDWPELRAFVTTLGVLLAALVVLAVSARVAWRIRGRG